MLNMVSCPDARCGRERSFGYAQFSGFTASDYEYRDGPQDSLPAFILFCVMVFQKPL